MSVLTRIRSQLSTRRGRHELPSEVIGGGTYPPDIVPLRRSTVRRFVIFSVGNAVVTAISIVLILNLIQSGHDQRTQQLNRIDLDVAQAVCTLIAPYPPDNGGVDALRAKYNCPAYTVPPRLQLTPSTTPSRHVSTSPTPKALHSALPQASATPQHGVTAIAEPSNAVTTSHSVSVSPTMTSTPTPTATVVQTSLVCDLLPFLPGC